MKPTPPIKITRNPEDMAHFKDRFSAIICVADSPCTAFRADVPAYWFPVHETGLWTYAPFYGAAKALDHLAKLNPDKPVLVHCHGGVNRSPSVVYAVLASNDVPEEWMDKTFPVYGPGGLREIYESNVAKGCVYPDTIAMLKARHRFPDYSIIGLLQEVASPNMFHPDFKRIPGTYNAQNLRGH